MGNKNKKKRKNSSKGDSAHTSKSNKEAKSGLPDVSDNSFNNSQLSNTQYLYSSPCVNPLMVNMNSNASPNGSVFGSPAGINMQYGMGLWGLWEQWGP